MAGTVWQNNSVNRGGVAVYKLGILEGDDIGLEVVPECVKVMKAAAAKSGLQIEWHPLPIGKRGHETHGHTTPQITLDTLKLVDGWVQGPIGHNAYPRNDPTWVNPPLRKRYELFANVKPVKSYPNLPSLHKDVDIVFVRETTEGMQSGGVVFAGSGEFQPNDEIAIGMRVVTRKGASRVARETFEIARTRKRKKVTALHKEPVYRLVCGMFAQECRKMAQNYPDVEFDEVLIDGFAMKAVMKPQQYDVVVTTNQFGDIVTDLGAGLVGGLGLAPGLVIGERQAMAQATHGSAPDIAGKNIANPYAMIMSGKMLLEWLGRTRNAPQATAAAALIDAAMDKVIAEARCLTGDLGGKASTAEMGDAVVAAL
jgi:3-isopropylmalate dehydrogenase